VTTVASSGPQAAIIRFALRFRGVVIALACVLLAYGIYALGSAKYDVFPEFAPPQVGIQTEAAGLTPEQVEVLVTRPIENAINGVPGVQTLRSTSIQGLSVVTVFFDPASDIYRNRQVVAERLAVAAQQLPQGVQAPSMTPLTSSTSAVLVAGLTSETRSLMDLRTIAEWTVRPRLLAVPGVAEVTVFGGDRRSIQVQVHSDQLIRYNLTLNDVLAVARRATGIRGAGFIDTENQRIVFQTEGQSLTTDDIARTVLLSQGAASVTLSNVADVVEAPEPPIGGAAIQGKPGVILVASEQYAANTIEVTNGVEAALQDLRPVLQVEGIALQADLFRPANFIDTATSNVGESLMLGAVLVTVVIFLFLFDLRLAAVSCAAIPLSLLAAAIMLTRLGVTFNTMTLGGLAIAIGVVVDDAIIDVENIVRRLRENARLPQPRPSARVVLDACLEVRSAVVYATLAVVLVVLPVMALSGIAGRLFAPLGLSYVLAVLASLLVALTVTPALSLAFLAGSNVPARDPPMVRWTRAVYESLLQAVAQRPRAVIGAAVTLTVFGCAALPFFYTSFIPELREGHFIIHMSAVPGTSIDESLRIGRLVSDALRRLPVVRSVAQRVGRAEKAFDTWGTHYSEFEVDLKPLSGEEAEQAQADVRKALSGFLGVNFSVKTFLTERVEETLSGYTAAVAVNVFGNDLDVLDQKAQEIARVLGEVPAATDVQIQSPPGLPQLTIRLRKPDLERWGFDAVEVLDLVRAAYQGDVVGQTYQGNQVFNVITILDAENRRHVTEVGSLPLRSPGGAYVLLKQVADVFESPGALSGAARRGEAPADRNRQCGRKRRCGVRPGGPGGDRRKSAAPCRKLPSVRRNSGSPGPVAARPHGQRTGCGSWHCPFALGHHPQLAESSAGPGEPAVRNARRSARGVRFRWGAVTWWHGRFRDLARNYVAQFDPDDCPLRALGGSRRNDLGTGRRHPRCRGSPRPHPHDLDRDGPRRSPVGDRRGRRRARDRRSHGDRDLGRTADFDGAEPRRAADPGATLWTVRTCIR
jgi:CzcA family heavy metal efflux pump